MCFFFLPKWHLVKLFWGDLYIKVINSFVLYEQIFSEIFYLTINFIYVVFFSHINFKTFYGKMSVIVILHEFFYCFELMYFMTILQSNKFFMNIFSFYYFKFVSFGLRFTFNSLIHVEFVCVIQVKPSCSILFYEHS